MGKFKMGDRVRDVISGLTGILSAHITYIAGPPQWCISAPLKADGSIGAEIWVHEARLQFVPAIEDEAKHESV